MKQIDFRVSIKFKDDGSTGFAFEPLVPSEWSKQTKGLYVWQHGMITSLRSALIKWSDKHEKSNRRAITRYEKIQRKFMKELSKAKSLAPAVQA